MAITMQAINSQQHRHQRVVNWLVLSCVMGGGLSLSQPVLSSDWNFSPTLSVNETYTSNLNLSSSDEESSFITQIAPGFSLQKQGARLKVELDYSLLWTDYSSNAGDDFSSHRLQSNANAELIEDYLFLDASAGISQQLVNNTSASTGNSALNNNAYTDTRTFSISPYWKQRIGDDLSFIARLTYDSVSYNDDGVNDSDGFTFSTSLDYQTDSNQRDFHWAIDINNSRVAADSDDDIDSDTARASVGYRFGPKLDTTVSYGYVDNHLDNSTEDSAEAGDFVGFLVEWTPTRRTLLEASYDTRKTTEGYGLNFSHRHRHLTLMASYTESLSDTRSGLLTLPAGTIICDRDDPLNCTVTTSSMPANALPIDKIAPIQALTTSLVNDRFIQKETRADAIYNRRKSTYIFGVFDRQREYQSGNLGEQSDFGINLGWRISMNSRTSGSINYSWAELELGSGETDHTNTLSASLSRQLDPETSVSLGVNFSDRNSDTAARDFDEQSVVASFVRIF